MFPCTIQIHNLDQPDTDIYIYTPSRYRWLVCLCDSDPQSRSTRHRYIYTTSRYRWPMFACVIQIHNLDQPDIDIYTLHLDIDGLCLFM
jgi:hypothetical protein